MGLGVVDGGTDMSGRPSLVAFAGRKKPGKRLLKLLPKRFVTQRSAADLWNTLGGQAHDVDFFFRERLDYTPTADDYKRELTVPSLVEKRNVDGISPANRVGRSGGVSGSPTLAPFGMEHPP